MSQELYDQGERRWLDTYSCGHQDVTTTFVGDFDRPEARVGDPARCFLCWPPGSSPVLTFVVDVKAIPIKEWE